MFSYSHTDKAMILRKTENRTYDGLRTKVYLSLGADEPTIAYITTLELKGPQPVIVNDIVLDLHNKALADKFILGGKYKVTISVEEINDRDNQVYL